MKRYKTNSHFKEKGQEFNPHFTVAYLKKGKGEKHTKTLKSPESITLEPKHFVFSHYVNNQHTREIFTE